MIERVVTVIEDVSTYLERGKLAAKIVAAFKQKSLKALSPQNLGRNQARNSAAYDDAFIVIIVQISYSRRNPCTIFSGSCRTTSIQILAWIESFST